VPAALSIPKSEGQLSAGTSYKYTWTGTRQSNNSVPQATAAFSGAEATTVDRTA